MDDSGRVYALLLDLKGDLGDLKGDIGGLRADVRVNTAASTQHDKRISGLERREARARGWVAAVASIVSAGVAIGAAWLKGNHSG
jgi:hypothetical protein